MTKGYPEVTDFIVSDGVDKSELLQSIVAVEALSQHPLAKAIVNYAHNNGVVPGEAANFQSITGKGAHAVIDGVTTSIGSIELVAELCFISGTGFATSEKLQHDGKSVMAVVTGFKI